MDDKPLRRYVRMNYGRLELRCAKCGFLGEVTDSLFEIKDVGLWAKAANWFAQCGWTFEGGPVCPVCSRKSKDFLTPPLTPA